MSFALLILLLVAGTLVLAGTAVLMASCWLVNRILAAPPNQALPAKTAAPAQVYRPVDAGPYTSPATDQLDVASAGPAEAVPSPSFLAALAITVVTLFTSLLVSSAAICGVRLMATGNGQPWIWFLLVLFGSFLVMAGVHLILLANILPTSWQRAGLVTAIEAVPATMLAALLLGLLLFAFVARSGPSIPVTPTAGPTAPSSGASPAPTERAPEGLDIEGPAPPATLPSLDPP